MTLTDWEGNARYWRTSSDWLLADVLLAAEVAETVGRGWYWQVWAPEYGQIGPWASGVAETFEEGRRHADLACAMVRS